MASKLTLDGELMFPNQFLSALEFKGRDVTLTIARVEITELQLRNGGKKKKPVLFFKETDKKFVCNVTNGESIAEIYKTTEATEWIGKRVTFYPTTCPVGRKVEPCIRVREKVPPPPKGATPPPAPSPQPPTTQVSTDTDKFTDSLGENPFAAPSTEPVSVG